MALVNFSNLDFDQIKSSIKSYLRSNSNFTDYDFEGSNLSILIDILAYNTYISSYNSNMLVNEAFLDGATLRENVVSLARNVGYLPRSITAAKATVSFFVDVSDFTTNPIAITLKKGVVCTTNTNFGSESFTFSIPSDITVPVNRNGIAFFDKIEIYEGSYFVDYFTVDSFNKDQRFIINNANVDASLLRINVRDTPTSSVSRNFKFVDNITNIGKSDNIFFLNEINDQRYEILFGDGSFGTKLNNDNYIIASYIVTNGELGNGISDFTFVGRLFDNNGSPVKILSPIVSTIRPSSGGSPIESVSSIKKLAPRVYASQNRAVTAADYEALLPQIYPETESVAVFGGEELDPPKYGKVFITVKPRNGSYIPNNIKDNLKFKLRKYAVAGIVPEFIDLKYLYIEYDSKVYYNTNLASDPDQLKDLITSNIVRYSKSSELNNYGSRFKYSKFLKLIDDSSDAITSNITRISIRRDLKIAIGAFGEYEICFGNEFHIKNINGYNIKTSGFVVDGITGTVYFGDKPNSDGKTGNIFLFKFDASSQPIVVRKSVGAIDYERGEIKVNSLKIIDTSKKAFGDNIIQFSVSPKSNDVIGKQDLYLQLDVQSSTVDMISDVISSGIDVSGSQYIVSSSYLNGDLVR